MKRIGIISCHASPLAAVGGADSGGRMLRCACRQASGGFRICRDIFTRKDAEALPEIVPFEGARVIHIPAGPQAFYARRTCLNIIPNS